MKLRFYSLFWKPLTKIAVVFSDEPSSSVLFKLVVSFQALAPYLQRRALKPR